MKIKFCSWFSLTSAGKVLCSLQSALMPVFISQLSADLNFNSNCNPRKEKELKSSFALLQIVSLLTELNLY